MKLRELETLCINSLKKYNICKFKLNKYTKDDCIIYNASKEIQYTAHNRKNTEKWYHNYNKTHKWNQNWSINPPPKIFKELEPLQ